jgi:maleamate amidohydrolase
MIKSASLGTVDELLDFYDQRGYRYKLGPGANPALVIIDFSVAFTGNNGDFPGRNFEPELAATCLLLEAARSPRPIGALRVPVYFTTLSYAPHLKDAGFWAVKVPWLSHCLDDSELVRIDPLLAPQLGEDVFVKKYPSSFFNTGFDEKLKAAGIDTLIIAGCTTSVCIRATALDAMQYGYRTIVAQEAVGDFNPALHALHLKDMGSRYADVMPVADVVRYLLAPKLTPYPDQ